MIFSEKGGQKAWRLSRAAHECRRVALWKGCAGAVILSCMPTAIKQIVTVQAGGVVEVRSPELHEGERAEVTVVVVQPARRLQGAASGGRWRRFAGAFNSRDARAGDNESIDADLATEYGRGAASES